MKKIQNISTHILALACFFSFISCSQNDKNSDASREIELIKKENELLKRELSLIEKESQTTRTEPTKPAEPSPTKIASKINVGKDQSNNGAGEVTQRGDYKFSQEVIPNENRDKGKLEKGSGSGPVVGLIGGFDAQITPPSGDIQDNGVVRLYICVNENGTVTTVKHDPLRGAPGTTTNSRLINKAISSIKQSSFKNVSGSDGGCGHFTYTFQVN